RRHTSWPRDWSSDVCSSDLNAGPKSPPLYPGADQSVIAVSATDFNDKPFTMANRGKYIAVAAPGVDVMVPAPGNGYQLTTGTSRSEERRVGQERRPAGAAWT